MAKLKDRIYYKTVNILKDIFQGKYISKVHNSINKLEITYPKELNIGLKDKVLLLAPHSDDESIGASTILFNFNKNLKVVCLTDGRYGDDSLTKDELIKIRKQEFSEAMRFCSVENYQFLDIEDTKLLEGFEQFNRINFSHYNYIFLPNYLDQHNDHKAVAKLLKKSLKKLKYIPNIKICFYEVWSTLSYINYYIDLSDKIDKKRELINIYKSQMKFVKYDDRIIALNQYRGILPKKDFVEGFLVMDIDRFLSIKF